MSVFHIPKKILKQLDAIHRAFFWAVEENCSGAQCLIAWKDVCKPKKCGGLCIKNLLFQNICLLMKFAFKLLEGNNLPWVNWYYKRYSHSIADKPKNPSFLWKVVNSQLPTLQNISFVLTNNGLATFFWTDTWISHKPLATVYPHIYSQSIKPTILVSPVMQDGLLANLWNRLTNVASNELVDVLSLLQDFAPNDASDDRFLLHGALFSSRQAYSIITDVDDIDPFTELIWSSKVPIKVKIFG